jgi:hypothetical protein
MHVINKPNEKGLACDFEQRAIRLPVTLDRGSFPNFPRFRVDDEEKCDPSITSIFGEEVYFRRDLQLSPNPSSDFVTISLPDNHNGRVLVVDNQARQVIPTIEVRGQLTYRLNVRDLPSGIYTIEFFPFQSEDRVFYSGRVVVE